MRDKSLIDKRGEVKELDDEFFKKAVRGRPPLPESARKQRVTIMLDREIVSHFKKEGRGWQTRVNAVLRQEVRTGKHVNPNIPGRASKKA